MRMFADYPVVWLKPEGLDLSALIEDFTPPSLNFNKMEIKSVSDEWLGTKRGITGYNDMMMSKAFYDMFADCEYILICHLDAWVFRDELLDWCSRGYDLVAAPWPVRPRYARFPLKHLNRLRERLFASRGIMRSHMYGRVGNGGLCLRKVRSFSEACVRYADTIALFKERGSIDGLYYEDLFWALVPQNFNYPDVQTALMFAYDLKPRLCHRLNGWQLPMGCHGFMRRRRMDFWRPFIACISDGGKQ